jgi:hypothetical protein
MISTGGQPVPSVHVAFTPSCKQTGGTAATSGMTHPSSPGPQPKAKLPACTLLNHSCHQLCCTWPGDS